MSNKLLPYHTIPHHIPYGKLTVHTNCRWCYLFSLFSLPPPPLTITIPKNYRHSVASNCICKSYSLDAIYYILTDKAPDFHFVGMFLQLTMPSVCPQMRYTLSHTTWRDD